MIYGRRSVLYNEKRKESIMEEKKLIRLIRRNPDKGIHEAIEMYGRPVHTICSSMLADLSTADIEEAEGDTFFKLWKNIGNVKEGSLKSYIYQIARNTCIDILRKAKPEEELPEEMGIETKDFFSEKLLQEILYDAVMDLGEPDSRVFIMKYYLLMKVKDIAEKLGMTEKTVENILYRDKGKLRENLKKRGIECYEDGIC